MDTAQWPQGNIGIVKPADQNSIRPATTTTQAQPRPPQKEQPVNCPRCNSANTKFCYYNNYSLSQPRYFCKTCRRYWTAGGSLRNVPVGGGSRKNKRSSSSSLSSASAKKVLPDLNPPGQDLNLAYNPSHQFNGFVHLPFGHEMKVHHHNPQNPNEPMGSRGFSSFMSSVPVSDSGSIYSSGLSFPVHDQFKSSLSFSLDGISDNGYNGNLQGVVQDHNANPSRLSFPFEELKPVSTSEFDHQQDRGHGETNGYWNRLLTGGGGSW